MANKILILHGLNNSLEAFKSLAQALVDQGFECEMITLPGHGDSRVEAKNIKQAIEILDQRLRPHIQRPYHVIAFSQGALYFQLWLQEKLGPLPIKQILLAPAISIKNHFFLKMIFETLPYYLFIKSSTPKTLRRYSFLYIWEYRILLEGLERFQQANQRFPVETMILIDPKDELINAQDLKHKWAEQVQLIPRPYLKGRRPGKYHILFHPDFYSKEEWLNFIERMRNFLLSDSV